MLECWVVTAGKGADNRNCWSLGTSITEAETRNGTPGASRHDFISGLPRCGMWPVGVRGGHIIRLHFSDLWKEDTGDHRVEPVQGLIKIIHLWHSACGGHSTSSNITVECLKGSKVAYNLCCWLPTDCLLSRAHPAHVLFMTEDFTTLEYPHNWRRCVCQ